MAKEDFCFTYYDGDAARDMAHMNRLERGCYTDLIISQRKFGHLSAIQIKKVLSKDFDECWPAIELVLVQDEEGKFYIEWLENSIQKMRRQSKKQKDNVGKRLVKPKEDLDEPKIDLDNPLGNGDGYVNEIIKQLEENNETLISESEKQYYAMLVLKMIDIFRKENPEYFFHKESDYSACLQIAYHIASMKKWTKESVVNGNLGDCLKSWQAIVLFIKKDEWLGTRSLTDLSKPNEWQRLVQKMKQGKYGSRNKSSSKDSGAIELLNSLKGDLGINE